LFFNLLDGLAYDPEPLGTGAGQFSKFNVLDLIIFIKVVE